jgi:hypothetical protein
MANVKITDLTAYTDPASTDVLPIVDVGADVTKKVTVANLLADTVKTDPTGVTGADQINNMMSLTQAEYDAIVSPDANTFYVITA